MQEHCTHLVMQQEARHIACILNLHTCMHEVGEHNSSTKSATTRQHQARNVVVPTRPPTLPNFPSSSKHGLHKLVAHFQLFLQVGVCSVAHHCRHNVFCILHHSDLCSQPLVYTAHFKANVASPNHHHAARDAVKAQGTSGGHNTATQEASRQQTRRLLEEGNGSWPVAVLSAAGHISPCVRTATIAVQWASCTLIPLAETLKAHKYNCESNILVASHTKQTPVLQHDSLQPLSMCKTGQGTAFCPLPASLMETSPLHRPPLMHLLQCVHREHPKHSASPLLIHRYSRQWRHLAACSNDNVLG